MKRDRGRTCKTYHDGVDFKIHNRPNAVLVRKSQWEGLPYDPVHFCHKHKCAGVHYRYGVTQEKITRSTVLNACRAKEFVYRVL